MRTIVAGFLALMLLAFAPTGVSSQDKIMLESTNFPGMFVRHRDWQGLLTTLSTDLDYKDATFNLVTGLTGKGVSFESAEYRGYYLRHKNFVIVLEKNDGSQLFSLDASFTRYHITGSKGAKFGSVNFPDMYIRHKNFKLVLDKSDNTKLFGQDSLFLVEAATAGPPAVDNGNGNGNGNNNDGNNGGGAVTAATDTTIYDQPAGNDVAYLSAGDPVTVVSCNGNNWCQISKPRKGWVWGGDLNR